ncbi:hypothetical protein D3C78_1857130 [compost metagenome]
MQFARTRNHCALPSTRSAYASIFEGCLAAMAGLAQGLPVTAIPEQLHVASMGLDVIKLVGRSDTAFSLATYA